MAGEELFGAPPPPNAPRLTDSYGGAVWGGEAGAAQRDINRYRSLGEAAQSRPGVMINYAPADDAISESYRARELGLQTRGYQQGAAGMLGEASRGAVPSRAAILSGENTQAGLRAQLQAGAGGRGALGQASAARSALRLGEQAHLQNVSGSGDAYAAELARASGAYGHTLGNMRGADLASATNMTRLGATRGEMAQAQAEQDFRQRELNQAYQQQMENYGYGTRNAELEAAMRSRARDLGVQNFKYENQRFEDEMFKRWLQAASGGVSNMGASMVAAGNRPAGPSSPSSSVSSNSGGSGYDPNAGIYRGDPYGSGEAYGGGNGSGASPYGGHF